MKADELRGLIEKYKTESNEIPMEKMNSTNFDLKREDAMKSYLADVGPISQYINEGFAEIEKEKNGGIEK